MRATLQPSRHFVHTQVSLDIHSGTVLYFSDVALDIFIWFVVTGMFYEISVTLPRTYESAAPTRYPVHVVMVSAFREPTFRFYI